MKKYSAVVLDDHDKVREMLVRVLRSRGFDSKGYSDPQRLLAEVFDSCLPGEYPDLLIVDLQLSVHGGGMALIRKLVGKDVSSEIAIVSGVLTGEVVLEATELGVGAAIAKPVDDYVAFIQRLERMAAIGRKRREYRTSDCSEHEIDQSRRNRPVFLSYSTADSQLATGLRRNLESRNISVWYAPTAIRVGDLWDKEIEQGIDNAQVFMALITDNYLASPYCVGELMRFHSRLEHGVEPRPLILPITMELSDVSRNGEVFRSISLRYQCINLSGQFTDGLMDMLWQINNFLGPCLVSGAIPSTRASGDDSEQNKGKNRVA